MIGVKKQIQFIEKNYDRIASNLVKFDMHKSLDKRVKELVPHYYQKNNQLFMIVNNQRMRCYCSDISGLIQLILLTELRIKSKVVYGEYNGSGNIFSKAKYNKHAWLELSDGTIVDGSYEQFQTEANQEPIRLKIVRPKDKMYSNWKKDTWEEPEGEPLEYIIEAFSKHYSERLAKKQYKFWHHRELK